MTDNLLPEDEIDPNTNYLENLVGEGKKFKTPEDLARGKYEADLYVNTLTKRMDEMREDYAQLRKDYNSRAKIEEVLDQQKTQQHASSENEPLAKDVDRRPEIKPEDIANMFATEIQKHETSKREAENYRSVQAKLKERFGSNKEALKQHLDELDLSEEFVKELAKKSPKVVLRTLGLDQPPEREDFSPMPRSSLRRDSFAPKTQKRTWSYYQDLKKSNPDLYHSKEITNQLHDDYIALGKDFEDGDFYASKFR